MTDHTLRLHTSPYEPMEVPRLPKKRGPQDTDLFDRMTLSQRHINLAGQTQDIYQHPVEIHNESIDDILNKRKYRGSTDYIDATCAISGDDLARLTRGA